MTTSNKALRFSVLRTRKRKHMKRRAGAHTASALEFLINIISENYFFRRAETFVTYGSKIVTVSCLLLLVHLGQLPAVYLLCPSAVVASPLIYVDVLHSLHESTSHSLNGNNK